MRLQEIFECVTAFTFAFAIDDHGPGPRSQAAGIPGLNLDPFYTSGLPYFNINPVPDGGPDQMRLGYSLACSIPHCRGLAIILWKATELFS